MRQFNHKVVHHLTQRLQVRFLRRCEKIGLQVVNGRAQASGLDRWQIAIVAKDFDPEAGVAAVWLVERFRGDPADCVCLYEYDGQVWQSVGGASGGRGRGWIAAPRPSSILVSKGRSVARSYLDRAASSSVSSSHWDVGWVGCSMFHAAAIVEYLEVGGRRIVVPDHGHVVAAWKAPSSNFPPQRPMTKAMGKNGTLLAEFAPSACFDSLDRRIIEDLTQIQL